MFKVASERSRPLCKGFSGTKMAVGHSGPSDVSEDDSTLIRIIPLILTTLEAHPVHSTANSVVIWQLFCGTW